MNAREVAWRVFSEEYNSSTLEYTGEGEKPASYVITPLGAKVNRMLVIGVATDIESIGDEGRPRYRARVADPTGTFYVSAGEYQPSAAASLSKMSPPAFVAVVGKSRAYTPEEGVKYLSIRPERVVEVDAQARDYWILETAKSTLLRIEAMKDAMDMAQPSIGELMKLGYPENLADGIVRALEYYKDIDLDRFRNSVRDALSSVLPGKWSGAEEAGPPARKAQPKRPEAEASEGAPEGDEEMTAVGVGADEEGVVLDLIEKLDAGGKGAPWDKVVEAAKAKRIDKVRLEEVVANLLDKGDVYEPELGTMKRI
jgi:RPA family protein